MVKWVGTQDQRVPRTPVDMDTVVSKEDWFLNSHSCFLSDSTMPLCLAVFSPNNYPYKHEDSYARTLLSALQA